jgi:hypothetical protein
MVRGEPDKARPLGFPASRAVRHDPHDADERRTPIAHTSENQVRADGTTIA